MSTEINIEKRIGVDEEGVNITPNVNNINFVGSGVTASAIGDDVTVNIPGPVGAVAYYLNESVSQAPYAEFSSVATAAPESDVLTSIAPGVTSYIGEYQTPVGVPNTTVIPAGLWQFFLHNYSGNPTDSWDLFVEVYSRDTLGTETLLFTTDVVSIPAMPTTPTMYITDGVFPTTILITTDRLVVKVAATNTGGGAQIIHMLTEGSAHYSVATTTLNQVVTTGAVTSVTGTAPVVSSGGTTPAISMAQADSVTDGYLSSTDWNTFNNKQDTISLTTTGTTGVASFIANVLNIPQYQGQLSLTNTGSSGNATLIANVLNIPQYQGALSFTTTGTTGAASLIGNALNIPQYQGQLTLTTTGTSGAATLIGDTLNIPAYNFTDTNIYNTDGTLTGDRTLNMSTHDMFISSNDPTNQYNIFFQNGTQQSQFAISLGNITNYIRNSVGDVFSTSSGATTSITTVTNSGSTIYSDITQVQGGITFRAVNGATTRRLELNTTGVRINNAFYLPSVDGTANQVLRTNGLGVTSWITPNAGTVTSVGLTAGTGISLAGTNPITSSGTITVTNSAPDQTVVLNAGTGISVTGTYPNFTVTNTGLSTSGRFGIADSAGAYTYYTTLTLAMAAATSGQTIEMFTDYTETGNVSITWKDGVNFNGNGHTYTHSYAAGNSDTIAFSAAAIATISDWRVIRTGRANGTSGDWVLNVSSNGCYITFSGVYMESTYGSSVKFGAPNAGWIHRGSLYAKGYLYGIYSTDCTLEGMTGESTSSSRGIYGAGLSTINNCRGISVSGVGIEGVIVNNSYGSSTSGIGIGSASNGTGPYRNCIGISVSGAAASVATIYNCTLQSTSGVGTDTCMGANNVIISSSNIAAVPYASRELNNCYIESTSNVAVGGGYVGMIRNCVAKSLWNSASGHGIVLNTGSKITNTHIFVTNSSASCIYNSGAVTLTYANNVYEGSTTPVNALVTQAIVNTQDNQGNILL